MILLCLVLTAGTGLNILNCRETKVRREIGDFF